jgi:hypothetical protein
MRSHISLNRLNNHNKGNNRSSHKHLGKIQERRQSRLHLRNQQVRGLTPQADRNYISAIRGTKSVPTT